MQRSIEKFLIISLLGIFLFSISIYLSAPETSGAKLQPSPATSSQKNGLTSSQSVIPPVGSTIAITSRTDIIELLFGVIITIIGLLAVALAMYRWKAGDLSLIAFGIFCFCYGARTRAFQFLLDAQPVFWDYFRWFLTYLTPLPAWIFFEQFLGKGWHSSIRRIWQLQFVFVIAAVAMDSLLGAPGSAMIGNNAMAIIGVLVLGFNLFRPGLRVTRELRVLKSGIVIFGITALYENIAPVLPPGFSIKYLEPFGFTVFIGCLVYVVAYRFFQNEKELITISHELETARQIQSFILPQETVNIKGLNLAAQYVPMAAVAGDFYDFIKVDDKRLGVLVADVSGHGVPASLISSMVKIAFSSQLPHAHDPARVLTGINQILCGKLESDFVTAGYLFMDVQNQVATYAGAGHPPLLVWRESEEKILEYRQNTVVLGQFEAAQYRNSDFSLESGDRLILYTDGIIEASNAAGEFFGGSRFKDYITFQAHRSVGNFTDGFIRHIIDWSGKQLDDALDDDLTLVVVDFKSS